MKEPRYRRSVERTLDFWNAVRGGQPLPRLADIRPWCQPQVEPDAFLVEFDRETGEALFPLGAAPVHAVGGVRVAGTQLQTDGAAEIWGRFAALLDRVKNGQPATEEGEAIGAHGRMIRFRTVVLPLSEDGKRVTGAVGTFSFKSIH